MVSDAVTRAKAQQLETAHLAATHVLEELRRVSFSDMRTLFDADGHLKTFSTLTADEAACRTLHDTDVRQFGDTAILTGRETAKTH